jgi:hypothetical protein
MHATGAMSYAYIVALHRDSATLDARNAAL